MIMTWLFALMMSIILIQYIMMLGVYISLGLVVVGIIFYVFCKYKQYLLDRPRLPVAILPPAIPPKPPIVIMEGGKATHIGVLMENQEKEPSRPISLYVPIYVAHV